MKLQFKSNLIEFLKYAVVGGICAIIDIAVNSLFLYAIFNSDKSDVPMVVVSVACGFIVGLVCNFILSNLFVFVSDEQREKGRTLKAFFIYAAVGIIGFLFTEGLTVLGTYIIPEKSIWYIILSCFVKGIVLVWNYLGRKFFVYANKHKGE